MMLIISVLGGVLTADDLGSYEVKIKEPLRIQVTDHDNNDLEVLAAPPPSSGVVGLMVVNVMGGEDILF